VADEFDKGGSRDLFGRLARLYDTDRDDPRLNELVSKVVAKGMDPNAWVDQRIGKTTETPAAQQAGADPRKDLSSSRPEVKPEKPTDMIPGADMYFSVPDGTPRGMTEEEFQAFQARSPEERRRDTDPVANDWIAQTVMAGPVSSGAGAILRGAPIIRTLLQGGKLARPVGAAAVGAGEGFAGNVVTGGDPTDLVAPAIGAVGRAAGGYASAARDPGTRSGRTIQAIEAVGGRPGLPIVQRPAVGGMFDSSGYRALPDGDIGTMQMAESAGQRIRSDLAGRMDAAGAQLGAAERAVVARRGNAPIDTSGVIDNLDDIRGSNIANDVPVNPAVDAAIQRQKSALAKQVPASTILGADGRPMVPAADLTEISFDDLRKVVKGSNEAAKFGGDPALKTSYGKRSAGAVADLQRGIDPEFDAALDNYASESKSVAAANDALIGKGSARVTDTAAREQRTTARLADVGRETKTGINRTRKLDRVLGPDYGPELSRMRARNAAQGIEFGVPGPGRPMATAIRAIPQNLTAAEVRILEPLGTALDAATGPALLPYYRLILEEARRADRQRNEDRATTLRGH
jgi:hypothetical protein